MDRVVLNFLMDTTGHYNNIIDGLFTPFKLLLTQLFSGFILSHYQAGTECVHLLFETIAIEVCIYVTQKF